jgi:hypothetical protein
VCVRRRHIEGAVGADAEAVRVVAVGQLDHDVGRSVAPAHHAAGERLRPHERAVGEEPDPVREDGPDLDHQLALARLDVEGEQAPGPVVRVRIGSPPWVGEPEPSVGAEGEVVGTVEPVTGNFGRDVLGAAVVEIDPHDAAGLPRRIGHPAVLGDVELAVGSQRGAVGPATGLGDALGRFTAAGPPAGDEPGGDLGTQQVVPVPHGTLRELQAASDHLSVHRGDRTGAAGRG